MQEGKRLPLEEKVMTEPTAPEKRRHKKLPALAVVGIVAGALILCAAAICTVAALRHTVYPNTTVLGVDMSGLTGSEAAEKWEKESAASCEAARIALVTEDGRELTALSLSELGATVSAEETARAAYAVGRQGNFVTNGYFFARSWFTPAAVYPQVSIDSKVLEGAVANIVATVENTVVEGKYELLPEGAQGAGLYLTRPKAGQRIDGEKLLSGLDGALKGGQDAVVCCFEDVTPQPLDIDAIYNELQGERAEARYDRKTDTITPSRVGVKFDVETVKAQMNAAGGGETILADAEVVFPTVTTEMLEEGLFRDVLGTYTTKVTGTSSRIRNVYLASQQINGRIYNSGEEFWYNATVGERTEARGFGPAPAYSGGKTIDSIGGGVCQVSSTLYYAALLANMKIVLRYCHQFAPGYITWGCDATVSWGGCDFAFRNNSDYPIQIVTDWKDNELTVTILGTKVDDTYVEMTNAVLSSTPWQTVYEVNDELAPGSAPVEVQTPYTGYLVKTYRNVYAGDGTLLSSTFEASSDYESRNRVYQVDRQTYDQMMFNWEYADPAA